MTCNDCGAYAPPDTETGYDADDLCPRCAARQADADFDADTYYELLGEDEAFERAREREVFSE